MTVDWEFLSCIDAFWEDPPGVFRVGKSRVLLELVLHAFQRGETAEDIVNSYSTLRVDDVISVIRRYLANPAPFEDYLRDCDERAEVIRRKIEASQRPQITREELLARAKAKGLIS